MTGISPILSDYRLRLPGPTSVPERVRAATSLPMLSHRGVEFRAILAETTSMLRSLIGTAQDVFILGASGTGGMEAALANVLSTGDNLLVVENGQFGERFATIAETMPVTVDRLQIPWGETPDAQEIAARITIKHYSAVVVVHNESATGAVADLASIGHVLRDTDTIFVVDSVSGVGGIETRMDEWGIDVLVTASQKSLMCPPGLAIVAVSAKAFKMINKANGIPRFYFDLRRAKASWDKGETPFTPPATLVVGLREALAMINVEGLSAVFARHARLSKAMNAGFEALGIQSFPRSRLISPTVSVGIVPDGLDGSTIVQHMYTRYRTVIAGQRTKLANRVIRIGTMGSIASSDILTDLFYLECTFRDLGRAPLAGAGVSAATRVLAS